MVAYKGQLAPPRIAGPGPSNFSVSILPPFVSTWDLVNFSNTRRQGRSEKRDVYNPKRGWKPTQNEILTSRYTLSTPLKKKKSTQKNQIKNKKIHTNKIKSNALFARLAPGPSSSTGLHHRCLRCVLCRRCDALRFRPRFRCDALCLGLCRLPCVSVMMMMPFICSCRNNK